MNSSFNSSRSVRRAAMVLLVAAAAVSIAADPDKVINTKHNLTITGPGTVKTTIQAEPCVFCHTPHAANPIAPLWNRSDPGTWYDTYESTTSVAKVGQPTGTSRLCLSCHDGTIALTQTFNARTLGGRNVFLRPEDRGYLGTDLRNDHPVSFSYDSALALTRGELADPQTLPVEMALDAEGQLQCTTCHDPHSDANGMFLQVSNERSEMCLACHKITDWSASAHANSAKLVSNAVSDEWPNLPATATVQDAACANCHRPHNAGSNQRLLRHAVEEDNCLGCHDGSVAAKDIKAQLQKLSGHRSQLATGTHDPTENPLTMDAHVECVDCHDSHRVNAQGSANAPAVQPAMRGASGLTRTGRLEKPAQNEYEVCYKCHSTQNFAEPVVDRVLGTDNIADEFRATNASFHPVETSGRSGDVPSLKTGWNTGSIVYCSDCHGSDDAGLKGPHGSQHKPLLKQNYSTLDRIRESGTAYAHCYSCHNRSNILSEQSTFKYHKKHVQEERTPCSVCHDPHGVKDNSRLINFDRDVVEEHPVSKRLEYIDDGYRRGRCYLRCHGENHNPESYSATD